MSSEVHIHPVVDTNSDQDPFSMNLNENEIPESIEKCVFDQQEKEKHQNSDLDHPVKEEEITSLQTEGTEAQDTLTCESSNEEKEVISDRVPEIQMKSRPRVTKSNQNL